MNAEFVDTNILVYAYDRSAGRKHSAAVGLLERVVTTACAAASTQVLAELYSVFTRKLRRDSAEVQSILRDMATWRLHRPDLSDLLAAAALQRRSKVPWWDALIVTSALGLQCSILWTEDLSHGRRFGSLEARNPFHA